MRRYLPPSRVPPAAGRRALQTLAIMFGIGRLGPEAFSPRRSAGVCTCRYAVAGRSGSGRDEVPESGRCAAMYCLTSSRSDRLAVDANFRPGVPQYLGVDGQRRLKPVMAGVWDALVDSSGVNAGSPRLPGFVPDVHGSLETPK